MFDEPPQLQDPEDDPVAYHNYLRRGIVAMVRNKVFVEHSIMVKNKNSYCPIEHPNIKDLADALIEFDAWREEFKIEGVD